MPARTLLLAILLLSLIAVFLVLDFKEPREVAQSINPSLGRPVATTARPPVKQPLSAAEYFKEVQSNAAANAFLVKIKEGRDPKSLKTLGAKYGVRELVKIFPKTKTFSQIRSQYPKRSERVPISINRSAGPLYGSLSRWYRVILPTDNSDKAFRAVREYARHPSVEIVQLDFLAKPQFVPDDPYYHSAGSWGQQSDAGDYQDLWGLKRIQVESAWDVAQGEGVTVAVVDTGVDYLHPDLASNVWQNVGEISGNGIDDDQNGYTDDVYGWNFADWTNDVMDFFGHGTHVAGIIGTTGNNGVGVIGVAPQAKVMVVKGLSDRGYGYFSDIARAIVYAAENGADVINGSWGCLGCPSNPIVEDAIQAVYGMGVITVLAAGNFASDVAFSSPQNMSEVITVAGSDPLDRWGSNFFSSYGLLVDVKAPGGGEKYDMVNGGSTWNILSLSKAGSVLEQRYNLNIVSPGYIRLAGTSMAAPHAAGLAALMVAFHPSLTTEEIRQALIVSGARLRSSEGPFPMIAPRISASRALVVDSVLSARVSSPRTATLFRPDDGVVTVTGTAAGQGFKNYQLFYGGGPKPLQWIPISEKVFSPVVDGVLGIWPIQSLATDFYTISLVVESSDGKQFEDKVQVAVEQPHQKLNVPSIVGPDISGNYLVYYDDRDSDFLFNLYLYDLSRNEERQLTDEFPVDFAITPPAISGNLIVWTEDPDGISNRDIFICEYDPVTEECPRYPLVTAPGLQNFPQIDGNRIVWQDHRWGSYYPDVYYCEYDRIAHTCPEQRITKNSTGGEPSVSGNYIVWSDSRHNGLLNDIYLYDLVSGVERRITTRSTARIADISGNYIVWTDARVYPTEHVYLYDLTIGKERQITKGFASTNAALIFGNNIVWEGWYWPDTDIYYYNISEGVVKRITSDFRGQLHPSLSQDRIVWNDFRGNRWDAYLYEIPR